MKRILGIILAAALLLGCCGCSTATKDASGNEGARYEGNGFGTPEEAALCYLAGLKNRNYEQVLSAFAWETQAEHLNFKAKISRAKGMDPTYVPGMPAADGLLRTAAVEQILDYQVCMIGTALENYINDEIYVSNTRSVHFGTEEETEEYFRRCDNGKMDRLAEMTNIRIYSPDDVTGGKFSTGRNPEVYPLRNAVFGADETKDVVIAADIGDETVAIAPTVARYGDRWYIVDTGSMTLNILGVSVNEMPFFVLSDKTGQYFRDAVPIASVSELPEPDGKKIRFEGEGFASPEDAAACYLDGLKNGDVRQMMQAFAWETQAERYSLKDYAFEMTAITYSSPVRMPNLNAFMTDLNMGSIRYQQFRKIYNAIRCYILEDEEGAAELLNGYHISLEDEASVDAFIRMFDNGKAEKLKKMDNIRMIDPADVLTESRAETVRKRLEINRRIYGADEIREVLAVAELDGETLICNPVLARYGNRWYMVSAGGTAFACMNIEMNRQAFLTLEGSPEEAISKLRR